MATRNQDAGSRLGFAADCVNGLQYLYDLDIDLAPTQCATDVLGHNWQIVDVSHARWALGTAVTAMDLCAAALGRLHCGIGGNAHDLAMPAVTHRAELTALPGVQKWANAVEADPHYQTVREIRRDLTHQVRPRHYKVAVFDSIGLGAGGPSPPPSGSTTDRTYFQIANGNPIAVRDLLGMARDVATRHVEAFVAAEIRGDLM